MSWCKSSMSNRNVVSSWLNCDWDTWACRVGFLGMLSQYSEIIWLQSMTAQHGVGSSSIPQPWFNSIESQLLTLLTEALKSPSIWFTQWVFSSGYLVLPTLYLYWYTNYCGMFCNCQSVIWHLWLSIFWISTVGHICFSSNSAIQSLSLWAWRYF